MLKLNKLIGISLIVVSIIVPLSYFTLSQLKDKKEERVLVQKIANKENYFAIIEIPKLNLKKELYHKSDKKNDVNKNILVHESSEFPKKIILASHSGNGSHAYFKNLYKLKVQDTINIYYQNKIYEYQINEIENQSKTGELYLKESNSENLVLITCTKNNNKEQTIYYSKLLRIIDL